MLAAGLLFPAASFARSFHVRPAAPASAERAGLAAPSLRPFPHLLERGAIGSTDGLGRTGNATLSSKTMRPTVLRRMPAMLSDRGSDPASALRAMAKLREVAEPETVRILALRVDFAKNSAGDQTTGDGRFDMRDPDSAKVAIDPPPHNKLYFERHLEALRRYYDVQTGGGLVLQYDVFPQEPDSAYHLPDTDRYGPWIFSVSSDSILTRAERFVRESVMLADSLDRSIDWKRYQSFLVFHAGTDFQGDIHQDTPYDIPSFNLGLTDSLAVTVGGADSVKINLVMVVPETVSQDGFTGAMNGVLAHEFGHQLGFFDLYDVFSGLPVVGVFSLMDSGEGEYGLVADPYDTTQVVAVRGILPASLDPWHRVLFFPDYTNLLEIGPEQTVSQKAVLLERDVLYLPVHLSEYFLAENREIDYNGDSSIVLRADPETGVILGPEPAEENGNDPLARLEYDYLLPGSGILVWHIDELAAISGLNSPYGGVNIYSDRRGVDVEEADGIQDIGTASPEFLGGPYDPYFAGGYTKFGPETLPDSRTNDGSPSGVSIEVLDPPGLEMRIRAGSERQLAGFPVGLIGVPVRDGLNQIDLDGDGFDEVLLAAGDALFGIRYDGTGFTQGGEGVLFASFPDTLEAGPAVVTGWTGEGAPAVLQRAAGKAWWLDAAGTLLGSWPADTTERKVTAGPIATAGAIVAGTSDGKAASLTLRPDGSLDQAYVRDAGLTGAATAVSAIMGVVVLGTENGNVARISDEDVASRPVSIGAGSVKDLLQFRAPRLFGGDAERLVLATTSDGTVDLLRVEGEDLLPVDGWPQQAGDSLAGSPAVGDPDGDGALEVAVTTRSGEIFLWDLGGNTERGWPKSVWHPDQFRRPDCTSGPRFWDVGSDGSVELIQLRGDGILLVWDSQGKNLPGWPFASGALGHSGPIRLFSPLGDEAFVFSEALSDTITALAGAPLAGTSVADHCVGCFPGPGGGPNRAGSLDPAMVPVPATAPSFLDPSQVVFAPNPVRGDVLAIRYTLGEPARMRVEAFDVSGRRVASARWDGVAGAAGSVYRWDLSALAPGPYVVQLRVEGDGESRTIRKMIAVVR